MEGVAKMELNCESQNVEIKKVEEFLKIETHNWLEGGPYL